MRPDSRRDQLIQRAVESLRGSERAERLGTALADLARELADARRQIATLKRENAALRAQLGAEGRGKGIVPPHPTRPTKRLQPKVGIGGPRRG
jgi:predicted RNase H-like nuclease (RuvC/YqgF family)